MTRQLIRDSLADSFADDVTSGTETVDGVTTVVIRVRGPAAGRRSARPAKSHLGARSRDAGRAVSVVQRRCMRGDDGNAIVEFVYLAILMMVPLTYLLLTVFRVQGATYAVSSATREAGRVFVTSASSDADARATIAASLVMADSGLELDDGQLSIVCSTRPCLSRAPTSTS